MSSRNMTIFGAIGAGLAFLSAGLPDETNLFIKLILGAFSASLSFYLGSTNQGTKG